jgi:cytochrome P450
MFTCYELARYPDVQGKLHQELVQAFPDPNQPISLEILETLPYLDGVCKEGLRIHAPIPSYLERVAPEGGLNVSGYSIPAGTLAGMQSYTNHRNENVYQDATAFAPERWVNPSPDMKLNFLPFSTGPRACIGLK